MLRKRKRNVFLLISRSRLNDSLSLMKVQPTGNQQLLDAPDERSVTNAKKRQRDVAPNQVSQDPFSNLVTLQFLEPAMNQKLTIETRSPIGTTAVLFFAKPKFVLSQWKHGWRIAENPWYAGLQLRVDRFDQRGGGLSSCFRQFQFVA